MSRIIILEINKAIANNQDYLIISNSAKFKKKILSTLHAQGFIQGLEFRGSYIIIYLKRHYWKNWGTFSKPIIKIAPLKLSKKGTISAKKWKKQILLLVMLIVILLALIKA